MTAYESSHPRELPPCTGPPCPRLNPTPPTEWAGSSGPSTASRPSSTRARHSATTPTSCSSRAVDQGVVVLMNAENSQDLFFRGRMGTVAAGVASLIEGQEPPPPPSNTGLFAAYALVLGVICLQAIGMVRSATNLRRRRLPTGRFGLRVRTAAALVGNLAWAAVRPGAAAQTTRGTAPNPRTRTARPRLRADGQRRGRTRLGGGTNRVDVHRVPRRRSRRPHRGPRSHLGTTDVNATTPHRGSHCRGCGPSHS